VRELAEALARLAGGLGAHDVRQDAADRGLAVAVAIRVDDEPPASALLAAVIALRMVATDLMVFAGIEPDEAAAAVREGIRSREVRSPPAPAGPPFSWRRWLRMPFSRKA
jgi:hypothetical protein